MFDARQRSNAPEVMQLILYHRLGGKVKILLQFSQSYYGRKESKTQAGFGFPYAS
ncbi:MAG: hypothetical protein AAF950_04715 [Pseudomonadota bacterium]